MVRSLTSSAQSMLLQQLTRQCRSHEQGRGMVFGTAQQVMHMIAGERWVRWAAAAVGRWCRRVRPAVGALPRSGAVLTCASREQAEAQTVLVEQRCCV